MAAYDIGFVLEQSLGHVTHTQNLQANVPLDLDVRAHWALVAFDVEGVASGLPIFRSNWTVRAGIRARRLLAEMSRQSNLDALFFHTQVPAILSKKWMRRIPTIVSLDATPLQYDELGDFYQHDRGPAWLEAVKWRLNRDCYLAARQLVVWAEWTKLGLVENYEVPADKITVIPPGVNVRDWQRPTPRPRHGGPVKILFVGGNLERKGGLLLLEAFQALSRDLDIELHLVTRDHVAPMPGVFVYNDMEPNSRPLKGLYHDCDVFALPTFGDCLPMVLSEASAAGMAIISTRVAAIPEIVKHGETGLTIPTGDLSALIESIKQLVDNPDLRINLGARALEHVAGSYDAQTNTRRLLDLLKIEAAEARENQMRAA